MVNPIPKGKGLDHQLSTSLWHIIIELLVGDVTPRDVFLGVVLKRRINLFFQRQKHVGMLPVMVAEHIVSLV